MFFASITIKNLRKVSLPNHQFRFKIPNFNISSQRGFTMKVGLLAILIHLEAFLSKSIANHNIIVMWIKNLEHLSAIKLTLPYLDALCA